MYLSLCPFRLQNESLLSSTHLQILQAKWKCENYGPFA